MFKKHIIFHILYIVVAPLCSAFLKYVDFHKAHRSEKRGVLWLASSPVRIDRIPQVCDGNVTLLAMSRRDEAKTIKPIINEVFVAFSEDIITDYNDSYGLFTCCIVPRKHNNMSAFVFVETPNKHYSTLLKTCIWIVRSKFFKY